MFVYVLFRLQHNQLVVQTMRIIIEAKQLNKGFLLVWVVILNWTDANTREPITKLKVMCSHRCHAAAMHAGHLG